MRRGAWLTGTALLVATMTGCNSTPEHVIPQEKMAQLLADIHVGESVVEINRSDYREDSLKRVLKQSIYAKHGVTVEQVDTSYVWYGHHIEEYIKVYDRVVEILEKRTKEIGDADDLHITVAGDSADAWSGVRYYVLAHDAPSEYISFSINRDENWEKGDKYQWRLKLLNNRSELKWSLYADYADGTTEYCSEMSSAGGWNDIMFVVDTARTATRIYGVAHVNLASDERVFIDSISLVRTRFDESRPYMRYNHKKFNYGKKNDRK